VIGAEPLGDDGGPGGAFAGVAGDGGAGPEEFGAAGVAEAGGVEVSPDQGPEPRDGAAGVDEGALDLGLELLVRLFGGLGRPEEAHARGVVGG
jgi:hypothetical protein